MIHNTQLHGPMQMEIIVTYSSECANRTIKEMTALHAQKCNQFNINNQVFFNQITDIKEEGTTLCYIYTVLLYANGGMR